MSPADRVDPVVGLTGARFGSSRRRRAAEAQADAAESRAADAEEVRAADAAAEIPEARRPAAAETLVADVGETAAAPAPERAADAVESRGADAEETQDEPLLPRDAQFDAAEDDGRIGGVLVRPYVRTGGRTRPAVDLAIEALVSTAPGAPDPPGADHRAIAALCASPRSVAEIAALLEIPLGVARVLVGDLAQDGGVVVHGTSGPDGPDVTFMQRVLDGLRRL
jgi:Protein of unknown function (DUF742)